MNTFIPKYTPEIAAMHQKLQEATERIVREHQIAIDGLTEKQVAEAFKQAVLAGDFQVHVVAQSPVEIPVWNGTLDLSSPKPVFETYHCQRVDYLPYRRCEELESENARLRKILEERGIDWKHKIEEEV